MRSFQIRAFLFAFLCAASLPARGDLFLDFSLDPGIQSSVTVASDSIVTVRAVFIPDAGTATLFGDSVGTDINWGFSGDAATATLMTPLGGAVAGPIVGAATGPVTDLVSMSTVSATGDPLASGGLSIGVAGAAVNSGGSAISDTGDSSFGGISNLDPSPTGFDLMGWDFLVSGSAGDIVTFAPSGILNTDGFPLLPGGAVFFDGPTGSGVPWSPDAMSGGFVAIVPEPSSTTLILLATGIACLKRRKRR